MAMVEASSTQSRVVRQITWLNPYEIRARYDRDSIVIFFAALDTWQTTTNYRGHLPELKEVVAPFTKEMHDWFGTPDWVQEKID